MILKLKKLKIKCLIIINTLLPLILINWKRKTLVKECKNHKKYCKSETTNAFDLGKKSENLINEVTLKGYTFLSGGVRLTQDDGYQNVLAFLTSA